jgi:hypothetical protein
MINQFLKLGGVNTIEEFYSKFPTESHFDNHVHQMKYGGGMDVYNDGGSYRSYQEGSSVTADPKPYGGVSIVDLLVSKGKAANYASRKKLAESLGMTEYTGRAGENTKLINMINSKPDILNNYEVIKESAKSVTKAKTKASKEYQPTQEEINAFIASEKSRQAKENPYITAPANNGFKSYSSDKSNFGVFPFDNNSYLAQPTKQSNVTKQSNPADWKGKNQKGQLLSNFKKAEQIATPQTPSELFNYPWMKDIIKNYNLPKSTKPVAGTEADARYLESGMITDKNKGVMYVVIDGKVVKTFPVMTGLNKDGETNNTSVEQKKQLFKTDPKNANKTKATPTGTYLSTPNSNMYGRPGFNMDPIAAFGQPAPQARDLAQHIVFGNAPKGEYGYDPKEYKKRMKIMAGSGENRVGSYGCTNMYGEHIDCLTGQLFPKGDTTIVVDSRRAKDQKFLKNKYGIKEYGGDADGYAKGGSYKHGGYYGNVPQHGNPGVYADGYSGTSSGGQYFADGGSYIPDYSESAYNLPQYEMGMAEGGPIYSDMTQYNHQGIVPAFDWMQDGGSPLYSTQGQQLRNFMNTVGYTPDGWMPNHIQLPPVGPRRYDDGGMSPDQAAMMAQQQEQQVPPQGAPQQSGGGIDPQQIMQEVAQMLQQGAQPEQIMQQLIQEGVPQEMAQQIIQQVMQQMQVGQEQEQNLQQEAMEGAPQAMYGMGINYNESNDKKGKFANQYKVGGEYDMNDADIKKLIDQGYKIQYI